MAEYGSYKLDGYGREIQDFIEDDENGFKMLQGNVKKFERKFVCVKRHLLGSYLREKCKYLHSYRLYQKYVEGVKYRKYDTNKKVLCCKHKKFIRMERSLQKSR